MTEIGPSSPTGQHVFSFFRTQFCFITFIDDYEVVLYYTTSLQGVGSESKHSQHINHNSFLVI